MVLSTLSKKLGFILSSLVILGLFFTTISSPQKVHAQSQSLYSSEVTQNDYTRVQATVLGLMGTIICQISGIDVIDPAHGCLGIDPSTGKLGYAPPSENSNQIGGLLGMTSNMIGTVYSPPASTSQTVRYLSQNFGFEKRAYAQTENQGGFGYLASVQNIWLKVRNISYLALVIVFMLIGFMIMLRVKIDPRTVMSIQNQIPKMIIGIVLITFSYSIVGALVDLMWVTTYFGINVLTDSGKTRQVATESLNDNPIEYASHILSVNGGPDDDASSKLDLKVKNITGSDISVGGISGVSISVGKTIGDVISRSAGELLFLGADDEPSCHWYNFANKIGSCIEKGFMSFLKYLIAVLAFLIVGLAILIALFRTWLSLLRAFIYVVIYTILAPLMIVAGLVPGSSFGFSRWFRAVLAHLLLFPVTAMVLVLARIFAENSALNNPNQTFVPPFIVNPNALDNMGSLIAFGIIMVVPELLTFVRDAVKAKPGPIGGIIGKGFGAGMPAIAPVKSIWKSMNVADHHKGEFGSLGLIRSNATAKISQRFKMMTSQQRGEEYRKARENEIRIARERAIKNSGNNNSGGTTTS
ncbi:MAG: hypothetical protein KBC15_03570 [Candidatus Levybacteria bacterium]|nr:hypothetical protein [Candidatus Levybacteria bacterium]